MKSGMKMPLCLVCLALTLAACVWTQANDTSPSPSFFTTEDITPSTSTEEQILPTQLPPGSPKVSQPIQPTRIQNTSTPIPSPFHSFSFIADLERQYAQPFANIPENVIRGAPSFHPYFSSSSIIGQLQKKLKVAPVRDKGFYIAQIIGYLGVQTKEELEGIFDESFIVPRWHVYDTDNRHRLTCNTYATTLMIAVGIMDISHWFGPNGVPQWNEGTEYQARDMEEWLVEYGKEYRWTDISTLSLEEKLSYLRKGYIIYGASQAHNWVIFGIMEGDQIIPVMTQSIPNTLFGIPSSYMFENNQPYTLFAHPLPGLY